MMTLDAAPRIAAPFGMPVYRHLNGRHPLLTQLVDNARGFTFLDAAPGAPGLAGVARAMREAAALGRQLTAVSGAGGLADDDLAGLAGLPPADRAMVLEYLNDRDVASQATAPGDVDLTFLHTAPLGFGAGPWVLHLENVATLFWPYLHNGRTRGAALRRQPIFPLITRVLAASNCRALFTHCRHAAAQLELLFPETVARKIRYAPPGVHIDAAVNARIDAALEVKHRPGRTTRMLFTNSWHQAPENFRNRGGLEVVRAFIDLHRQHPDVHLVIRSAFPPFPPGDEIGEALAGHPAITVLDGPVSDNALSDLLAETDIFLLPSAALHSVSVMRAMAYGAVCVVSDLPVFEEFLTHGETGVVVPGRYAKIYDVDPDSGWEWEDYAPMRTLDRAVAGALTGALLDLCRDVDRRRAIALAARRRLNVALPFRAFLDGFETVLREGLAAGPAAPAARIDVDLADALARSSERHFGLYHHPHTEYPIMSGEYRGFNLVWLQGRIHAVRQGAREDGVDLTLGEAALRALLSPEDLVIGDNIDLVRARIDGIEAERRLSREIAAAVEGLRGETAAGERRLSARIDVLAFGPAGDPSQVLPVGEYRGFNLVWRGGKVHGLRQGAGAADWSLDETALRASFAADDLIIGSDEAAVRTRIDSWRAEETLSRRIDRLEYGPTGDPEAITFLGSYREFNIVRHGARIFAMRQGLGEVDVREGEAALSARFGGENFVAADHADAILCRIDLIELERRRIGARLFRSRDAHIPAITPPEA